MEKNRNKEWELAIREAKSLNMNFEEVRYKIVEIAHRVCDISIGGRRPKTQFSLTRFAQAIDLHPHTLMEWSRIKKGVLDKLPDKLRNHKDFKYTDASRILEMVGSSTANKSEIKNAYMIHMATHPENKTFTGYLKYLSSILYKVTRPIMMGNVDEVLLKRIINDCKTIIFSIEKEIEFREKFNPKDRQLSQNKRIKHSISEANELLK